MAAPEPLWAAAIRLATEVMAAVPSRLDATASPSSPRVIRFGPAEVPSGRRRMLTIRVDPKLALMSIDGRVGALRWTLYDAAGNWTNGGLMRANSVALVAAVMDRAVP